MIPQDWVIGVNKILQSPSPPQISGDRWVRFKLDLSTFLPQWDQTAVDLGWTAVEIFGVHYLKPHARPDGMGLVFILHGDVVTEMTEIGATIMTKTRARHSYPRIPRPEMIPAWELFDV